MESTIRKLLDAQADMVWACAKRKWPGFGKFNAVLSECLLEMQQHRAALSELANEWRSREWEQRSDDGYLAGLEEAADSIEDILEGEPGQ